MMALDARSPRDDGNHARAGRLANSAAQYPTETLLILQIARVRRIARCAPETAEMLVPLIFGETGNGR
jgi:hypothetical protein